MVKHSLSDSNRTLDAKIKQKEEGEEEEEGKKVGRDCRLDGEENRRNSTRHPIIGVEGRGSIA